MPSKSYTELVNVSRNVLTQIVTPGDQEPPWQMSDTYLQVGGTRSDSGPVPSWRNAIKNGDSANSILTGTKTTAKVQRGDYYLKSRNRLTGDVFWHRMVGDSAVCEVPVYYTGAIASVSDRVDDLAKIGFVKKCIQVQSALQGQVFLGELREAIDMIRHPARSLRRGIDDYFVALKKRRRGNKAQRAKAAAGTWLEYSFGWTPFISDIEAGAKAVANIVHRRAPFQMVSYFASNDVPVSFSADLVNVAGGIQYVISKKRYATVKRIYRGVVNLKVDHPVLMTAQNLGFRWDQFVPTIWELIPYSFLVDYFTNIGDLLTCHSFASSNLKWCWVTSVDESHIDGNAEGPIFASSDAVWERTVLASTPGRSSSSHRAITRLPATSLVPSLRFDMPGLGVQWLNIAALGVSRRSMRPY